MIRTAANEAPPMADRHTPPGRDEPAPMPAARLIDVGLRYGKTRALDAINLDLPAGCMVGLIGPDGVGKSSLLSLIAGARRVQDGTVLVLGGDMADAAFRREFCPRIAYMPQGLGKNLYPTLSVFENADFFGRLFGQGRAERKRRIAHLLESTGMAPFADRPAGKLSGGMKQKLSLCCALIHDPDLLILDEPTTGVDPLSRRQFWDLIDRIRADRPGMSVLVATAYMDEAARFDWLVAMDGGRVLATGALRGAARAHRHDLAGRGLHRPAAGGEASGPHEAGHPAPPGGGRRGGHRGAGPHPAIRRLRRGRPREPSGSSGARSSASSAPTAAASRPR